MEENASARPIDLDKLTEDERLEWREIQIIREKANYLAAIAALRSENLRLSQFIRERAAAAPVVNDGSAESRGK